MKSDHFVSGSRRCLVALVASIGLSSCATTPTVALTRDLPSVTVEVGPAFNQRIRARYPLGSTDEAMGLDLARNEFHRIDWTTSVDAEHRAQRTEFGFPCRRDFWVSWHSDAEGRLTRMRGEAGIACL